jgi:hypothetical protein
MKIKKEILELEKALFKLENLHASFDYLKISVASPKRIKSWTEKQLPNGEIIGEVLKAETINFRTNQPEVDGLFCEKIFGPTQSWQCKCGKYNGFVLNKICEENRYFPNIKDLEIITKYFKFDKTIIDEVNNFIFKNFGKKTLGLYGFSNDINEIDNKIDKIINEYDCIFISNGKINSINKINGINVTYYLENNFELNKRLNKINDIINKIKIADNDINKLVDLEKQLKYETKNNKLLLSNCIINYLILLNCENILNL